MLTYRGTVSPICSSSPLLSYSVSYPPLSFYSITNVDASHILVFPVFGAASGGIAVLPLAFILTVTAIKDAVEDYRRATLDEELNTSPATKLGSWRNVNVHTDPRPWFEKLLGINTPGKVTKGMRKVREKEASDAGEGMRVMLSKAGEQASAITSIRAESLGEAPVAGG